VHLTSKEPNAGQLTFYLKIVAQYLGEWNGFEEEVGRCISRCDSGGGGRGSGSLLLTRKYTLTVSVTPENWGSVSLSSGGSTSVEIVVSFSPGVSVTLTESPASGYVFANWEGDASGDNALVTIVMNSNKAVTAHFAPPTD
jgi:hypothetical protein